jgi:hypothetical protein
MKVIAALSQMAHGKDVFCDYLCECLNDISSKKEWTRSAFANAVKDTFCNAFNVDRNFIENWKRNSEAPDGFLMPIRQCLQFIGDGYRKIRENIWIEIALKDNGKNIIISDGRYFNEAEAVREKNGLMFLIYRPGFINDDPNPSESQVKPLLQWASGNLKEGPVDYSSNIMRYGITVPHELRYFDYFIKNDGSIEDLHKKIREDVVPFVLKKIKG